MNAHHKMSRKIDIFTSVFLKQFCSSIIIISTILLTCSPKDNISKKKDETLTSDERYLVSLYVKITKLEGNLQDNQEKLKKKLSELRDEADTTRIKRTLEILEQNPERWLTVYSRIHQLLQRSEENKIDNSN